MNAYTNSLLTPYFAGQSLDVTQAGSGLKVGVPWKTRPCSSPAPKCRTKADTTAASPPSPKETLRDTSPSQSGVRDVFCLHWGQQVLPTVANQQFLSMWPQTFNVRLSVCERLKFVMEKKDNSSEKCKMAASLTQSNIQLSVLCLFESKLP